MRVYIKIYVVYVCIVQITIKFPKGKNQLLSDDSDEWHFRGYFRLVQNLNLSSKLRIRISQFECDFLLPWRLTVAQSIFRRRREIEVFCRFWKFQASELMNFNPTFWRDG